MLARLQGQHAAERQRREPLPLSAGGTLPIPDPIVEGQCNTFDDATTQLRSGASRRSTRITSRWRVALDWSPNDDTLFYASSRGYKSGTSPVNAASKARQNAPVTQEKADRL